MCVCILKTRFDNNLILTDLHSILCSKKRITPPYWTELIVVMLSRSTMYIHIVFEYSSDCKTFKTRDDFSSVDEYARYVKENIKVGLMVKCCEAYEEVRHGDIGRVMKVSMKKIYEPLLHVCLC